MPYPHHPEGYTRRLGSVPPVVGVVEGASLDIDDTCDALHGHQQLSLFHAHYHVESGKPVAVLLRPGKTPTGAQGPHPHQASSPPFPVHS